MARKKAEKKACANCGSPISAEKRHCDSCCDTTPGIATRQPAPAGEGTAILPLVLDDLGRCFPTLDYPIGVANDLRARALMGREKYGTVLRAFNGRDCIIDAYQELTDHVMYLRQKLEEGYVEGLEEFYEEQLLALMEFREKFVAPRIKA